MKFYVYVHKDDAGNIFYVGKGSGRRAYKFRNRSKFWWNYVTKHCKALPKVEIVNSFNNEEAAFALETSLIQHYGRRDKSLGLLVNLTDGGEGISGAIVIPSETTKFNQAKAAKARWSRTEEKARQSQIQRKRFTDPEQRRKASEANKNNPKVLEAVAKGAEAVRGKEAWNKGQAASEETKAKQAQAKRDWYASLTPEQREAHNIKLAEARAKSKANKPREYSPEELEARKQAKREYIRNWKRANKAKA